ncbi:MAG: NUDIX hydrolase [Methanosarcinales archaeon]|nr:NUDIX hydrolase [ANME-2 cluster archaeon]MDF1531659.1 NUDIX hydrolase [ANME-2 cluster archaeon]MDW7775276.1 NUDIX hydrolase [Methanosarcinales archaeon]
MSKPRTPLLTVDILIVSTGKLVLIRRRNPPFRGHWALPGGFVEVGETVEEAAMREAHEETGLSVDLKGLVGVFSEPGRDPRGHTVSICFAAIGHGTLQASSDAQDVALFDLDDLPPLAFDHLQVINTGRQKIQELMHQVLH